MKKIYTLINAVLLSLALASCSDSGSTVSSTRPRESTIKLAVILPLDSASSIHWKQTTEWFLDNLAEAFLHLPVDSSFTFDIEWFDENTLNMDSLGEVLSERTDIHTIIGPLHSQKLDSLAKNLSFANQNEVHYTLIAPMSTAAEIIRKYAGDKWFFSLTETDVALSELILDRVLAQGGKTVSLLASSSDEVNTFVNWFAFQATEIGLKPIGIHLYDDASVKEDSAQITGSLDEALNDSAEYVICAPKSYTEVPQILKAYEASGSRQKLLFTSGAHNDSLLSSKNINSLEGFSAGADPENGFDVAYAVKFNQYPIAGEAQYYDALLITAFAEMYKQYNSVSGFNSALDSVVIEHPSQTQYSSWEAVSMSRILESIMAKEDFGFKGASGDLKFDFNKGSVVMHSVYTHWKVYKNKFVPIDYISSDGSKRTVSTASSYNWSVSVIDNTLESDSTSTGGSVADRKGTYALLITTSTLWKNYRHQSDILTMYQVLKSQGMDDDHIILILEDNLYENAFNPNRGIIINFLGDTVSTDIEVDYHVSEITPDDIISIMLGKKSDHLPHVIEADSTYDVFVYWSGHGAVNQFNWIETDNDEIEKASNQPFTLENMQTLLREMSSQNKFRRMLWMVETCYAGSVCSAFNDSSIVQGAMCMTSANALETSKAVVYNNSYCTYMTDSFSMNIFVELGKLQRKKSKKLNLNDIYYYAVNNTLGSHVSIYHTPNFGSLYTADISEFISP